MLIVIWEEPYIFRKVGKTIFKTSEQGAETIIYLATANEDESTTGHYFEKKQKQNLRPKNIIVNKINNSFGIT